MALAVMQRGLAASPGPPRTGDRIAGSFEGDLACLTAFELLQVFQYLGKTGRLQFESHGQEASCDVVPRGLVNVECGRLREWDAALAFVWWKEGSFRFEVAPAENLAAGQEPLAVQELLLDAVQLADEIEARNTLIPERAEPLYRLLHQPVPQTLGAVRGALDVLTYLQAQPGATRRDLEQILPYAPVTLGFAVARLIEEGFIGAKERANGKAAGEPARSDARRIVRALFAFDREHADEADETLHRIEACLGATPSPHPVDPATPSFLRTRLPSGCFLSLTALPISRRNRFVLESLAPSLALAVLRVGNRSADEVELWKGLLPRGVEVIFASTSEHAVSDIVAAVQLLERGAPPIAGALH